MLKFYQAVFEITEQLYSSKTISRVSESLIGLVVKSV